MRWGCQRNNQRSPKTLFEELAVMFKGSTASGAERAYRRAVDKLTELLVADGAIHAVRLKQKSKTKRKQTATANGARFHLILRMVQQRSSGLPIGIR